MESLHRKALILFFVTLGVLSLSGRAQEHITRSFTADCQTFFGLHIHRASPTTWPPIPFGAWRLWDADGVVWAKVEPKKGEWNFSALDKYVALAEEHHVQVMMPLGTPPPWASARPTEAPAFRPGSAAEPRDMQDWRDYVQTMATRYKGKVHFWELWNEINDKGFYTGTPQKMVDLAKEADEILKRTDPQNALVSPSFTYGLRGIPALEAYMRAGGGEYADVIGSHYYVQSQPPEAVLPLADALKKALYSAGVRHKALWDTEVGYFIYSRTTDVKPQGSFSKILSDDEGAAYVTRFMILNCASEIVRVYWYDWDSDAMGLGDGKGTKTKPAAVAYGQLQKWLVGAVMTSCDSDVSHTWVCGITRDGGYEAHIVWNTERNESFRLPSAWRAQNERELDGSAHVLKGASSIQIGIKPILLENKTP